MEGLERLGELCRLRLSFPEAAERLCFELEVLEPSSCLLLDPLVDVSPALAPAFAMAVQVS